MKDVWNSNSSSILIKNILKQQDLRLQFKHIDDSLCHVVTEPKFTENITRKLVTRSTI
jgi:hypothetical protein